MLELQFKNDQLIVTPEFKVFEEFDNILKQITPAKKANQVLLYIYFLCDRKDKNPLRDVDVLYKEEQCRFRAFGKKDITFTSKEQTLIDGAIKAYKEHNETAKDRVKYSILRKIDEIGDMLDGTKPELLRNVDPRTGNVTFVSNTSILMNSIKELDNTLKTLDKVEASIMKQTNLKRTGDRKPSLIESGRIGSND